MTRVRPPVNNGFTATEEARVQYTLFRSESQPKRYFSPAAKQRPADSGGVARRPAVSFRTQLRSVGIDGEDGTGVVLGERNARKASEYH